MLTVISGNNRNGYPCALNKVGDIFQRGIPPFETEGLTDFKSRNSQDASQKGGFPLAGLRSQMLGSVKVTASEESKTYAGVTVSMTSGESKTYANLSSPESGSVKYSQRRSPMPEVTVTSRNAINALAPASLGVCPDNLLNIKAESAFVQTTGKEKGPEVNPALLSTLIISSPRNSQALEHNSHLQATGFAQCQPLSQPLGSTPRDCNSFLSIRLIQVAKDESPSLRACSSNCPRNASESRIWYCGDLFSSCIDTCNYPLVAFLYDDDKCNYYVAIIQRSPAVLPTLTGPLTTNDSIIIEVAMSNYTALIGRDKQSFTQTRPEFIDTYWIIPEYETTPYGKVSLTRQDRRTFIAMFKDSRLIWAGRQPVKDLTENVICTQLQKLPVEGIAEGIEEISIPQGMVKITTPSISTITEIVTVQEVAHV